MGSGRGQVKRTNTTTKDRGVKRSPLDSNGHYASWPLEDLELLKKVLNDDGIADVDLKKFSKDTQEKQNSIIHHYLGDDRMPNNQKEAEFVLTEYLQDIISNQLAFFGGVASSLPTPEEKIKMQDIWKRFDPELFMVSVHVSNDRLKIEAGSDVLLTMHYNGVNVGEHTHELRRDYAITYGNVDDVYKDGINDIFMYSDDIGWWLGNLLRDAILGQQPRGYAF